MTLNHISIAAYYRLFVGSIFKNYDKILYLDCDLVIRKDLSELYNLDIGDNVCAAAINLGMTYFNKSSLLYNEVKDYMSNVLKIGNLDCYFNSGVMVFNLKLLRDENYEPELIRVAKINNKYMHDQNVLNAVFKDKYYELPLKWNYQWHVPYKYPDYRDQMKEKSKEYDNARFDPSIVHYLTPTKPWSSCNWEFKDLFWSYAQQSPFYDVLDRKKNAVSAANKSSSISEEKYIERLSTQSSKIIQMSEKIAQLEEKINKIERSHSYRIGRMITYLPRLLLKRN